MKRYVGPFLKLLLLLAFLSRLEFVFGQAPVHATFSASTLGDEVNKERLMLKASPKAFSSKTDLSFVLRQDSNYKLEVLDMQGRLVAVLAEGTGMAGQGFVYLFKKGKYPAGAYIARLITRDEVTSARFILE